LCSGPLAEIRTGFSFWLETFQGQAQSRVVVIQDIRRSMIAQTTCQHCGQHIEFDVAQAIQFLARPPFSKQIRRLLPEVGRKPNPTNQAQHTGTTMQSCPDCAELISLRALVCPKCGFATGFPFRFVLGVMCKVMLVNLIYVAIGLVAFFLIWRSFPLVYIAG